MNPNLIFDIGMADGADTRFYLAKGFRVIAVEADPATAGRARAAFAREIAEGRLELVQCAVAERDGRQTFYCNREQPNWGSLQSGWGNAAAPAISAVEIETVSLPTMFARYGIPYFAKIDIEGYDSIAIGPLAGCSERPPYLSIELHTVAGLEALAAVGYRSFKLVNQTMLWKVRLPDPPREGLFVGPDGWQGASGPFGREAAGREWVSLNDAMRFAGMFLELRHHQDFLVYGWLDAHARLDPPGPG